MGRCKDFFARDFWVRVDIFNHELAFPSLTLGPVNDECENVVVFLWVNAIQW